MIKLSRQKIRIAGVAVALLVGGGWWMARHAHGPKGWQGYAEGDYIKVSPQLTGRLTAVSVARGSQITAGTPLFDQDDTAERAGRDQAKEQLANLESGGKATEIEQAEANVADATATQERARIDLARGEALLATGNISKQAVDQLRAAARSARARAQAAAAALTQLQRPLGREREIAAQQAVLDNAEWRLAQRHVQAPANARVVDVLARPGETVNAGEPVVSLLPAENILVRFFVPEPALASIHRGDAVALQCDTCPQDLTATVTFISPQAEYTPPLIYSESTQSKLVFLVEAHPRPEQTVLLNPGQPILVAPTPAKKAP